MSTDINNSIENLLLYKGALIKNSKKYREYVRSILEENCINDSVESFVAGAVDGMIYDIACSLDFTKQKGKINDWSSWRIRRKIINKLWGKM